MAFAQGDIVILPFPYSDRLIEKRRPALVISAPALETRHGIIWVAMITSDRGGRLPADVPINSSKRTGLSAPSIIRPTKLATIEPKRILRRAGAAAPAELQRALAAVIAFLKPSSST